MRIILCGVSAPLMAAWASELVTHPDLQSRCRCESGDILALTVDAVVSPANSFGFMDGGIDQHYTNVFGPQVQERLQTHIRALPLGELLVGQAVGIATDHPAIPWCICAPTMRVPMQLYNATPAYLATRAAVIEATRLGLSSLAIPGMGTGTGGLPPNVAARAMLDGVRDALRGRDFPAAWHAVDAYAVLGEQGGTLCGSHSFGHQNGIGSHVVGHTVRHEPPLAHSHTVGNAYLLP